MHGVGYSYVFSVELQMGVNIPELLGGNHCWIGCSGIISFYQVHLGTNCCLYGANSLKIQLRLRNVGYLCSLIHDSKGGIIMPVFNSYGALFIVFFW